MTLKEATVYQEAICAGLHETGKDSPYRDDMIPKMKESCELAIRSLEAWEKVRDEIKRMPTGFLPDMQSVYADITKQRCLQIINKHLSEVEDKG